MKTDRRAEGCLALLAYPGFIALALLLVGLQISQSSGQPYTPPEDWAVYGSAAQTASGMGLSRILAVDYFPLDIWTSLFGISAPVTRWLSTLFTILGLAFLYHLGADWMSRRSAFMAVALLGTLALARSFIWQAQPYAALLMIVPALLLTGWRGLHRPAPRHALLYLAAGILSVYTATFSVFLIVAQMIFWLVFMPRDGKRDRQAVVLFAVILLAALPRIIAFAHVNRADGQPFNNAFALDLLRVPIPILPAEFAQLIVLLALAAIATGSGNTSREDHAVRLRWGLAWMPGYPLALLIGFGVLLLVASSLTIGVVYAIAALPIVALLAARGLETFPRILQGVVLVAVFIFSVGAFRNPIPGTPYQAIAAQTLSAPEDANAKLIVAAPYVWQHRPFAHYTPADRTLHIVPAENAPEDPQTAAFIDQSPEIWLYTEPADGAWVADFSAAALENYDEIRSGQRWWYMNGDTPAYGDLRKFVHVPDDLPTLFGFGDQMVLHAWRLKQSVNVVPCQFITVQSWWSGSETISTNLSMTLVLVNSTDGQGIANTDGMPAGRDSLLLKAPEPPHVDERRLQVPCDIQPGEYPLLIGAYRVEGDSIQPLPVTLADGSPVGNFAYLTTLFVRG